MNTVDQRVPTLLNTNNISHQNGDDSIAQTTVKRPRNSNPGSEDENEQLLFQDNSLDLSQNSGFEKENQVKKSEIDYETVKMSEGSRLQESLLSYNVLDTPLQ